MANVLELVLGAKRARSEPSEQVDAMEEREDAGGPEAKRARTEPPRVETQAARHADKDIYDLFLFVVQNSLEGEDHADLATLGLLYGVSKSIRGVVLECCGKWKDPPTLRLEMGELYGQDHIDCICGFIFESRIKAARAEITFQMDSTVYLDHIFGTVRADKLWRALIKGAGVDSIKIADVLVGSFCANSSARSRFPKDLEVVMARAREFAMAGYGKRWESFHADHDGHLSNETNPEKIGEIDICNVFCNQEKLELLWRQKIEAFNPSIKTLVINCTSDTFEFGVLHGNINCTKFFDILVNHLPNLTTVYCREHFLAFYAQYYPPCRARGWSVERNCSMDFRFFGAGDEGWERHLSKKIEEAIEEAPDSNPCVTTLIIDSKQVFDFCGALFPSGVKTFHMKAGGYFSSGWRLSQLLSTINTKTLRQIKEMHIRVSKHIDFADLVKFRDSVTALRQGNTNYKLEWEIVDF